MPSRQLHSNSVAPASLFEPEAPADTTPDSASPSKFLRSMSKRVADASKGSTSPNAQIEKLEVSLSQSVDQITAAVIRSATEAEQGYLEEAAVLVSRRSPRAVCLKLVIFPTSRGLLYWRMFVSVLVLYNAIILPLQIAFDLVVGVEYSDHITDGLFLFDVLVNFRTAFFDEAGLLQCSSWAIAAHYARGWMLIDVVSSLPYDVLTIVNGGTFRYLSLLKCLRLLRIGRLAQLMDSFQFVNAWRFARLLAFLFLCVHWLGCCWFLIGTVQPMEDPNVWVRVTGVADLPVGHQYVASAFSVLAMLVGGNASPGTMPEQIFTIFVIVIGACLNATLFGQMALLIHNNASASHRRQLLMDSVNQNMRILKLPDSMQQRVRNYYEYSFSRRGLLDHQQFLSQLSDCLASEISLYLHRDMVQRVPLFSNCDAQFLVMLVRGLKPAMFMPGDYIIRAGEIGHEMYFLACGECEVLEATEQRRVIATLRAGSYFGELALLSNKPRMATIRAATYCEAHVLSRSDLDALLALFPRVAADIKRMAKERSMTFKRAAVQPPSRPQPSSEGIVADNRAALQQQHNEMVEDTPYAPILPPPGRAELVARDMPAAKDDLVRPPAAVGEATPGDNVESDGPNAALPVPSPPAEPQPGPHKQKPGSRDSGDLVAALIARSSRNLLLADSKPTKAQHVSRQILRMRQEMDFYMSNLRSEMDSKLRALENELLLHLQQVQLQQVQPDGQ